MTTTENTTNTTTETTETTETVMRPVTRWEKGENHILTKQGCIMAMITDQGFNPGFSWHCPGQGTHPDRCGVTETLEEAKRLCEIAYRDEVPAGQTWKVEAIEAKGLNWFLGPVNLCVYCQGEIALDGRCLMCGYAP